MESLDDLQSLLRLKAGDIGGLEALVEAHQVRAVRTAYLITHDRGLAEEVVQTAFLRVYRSIDRFDMRRPFQPYFMRIVVNAAVQAAQRDSRLVTLDTAEDWNSLLHAPVSDPQDQAEADELRENVRQALLALTPEQRAAVVLRYYLNLSESEMSAWLGAPEGTIKWRLHAARKHLRVLLDRVVKEG